MDANLKIPAVEGVRRVPDADRKRRRGVKLWEVVRTAVKRGIYQALLNQSRSQSLDFLGIVDNLWAAVVSSSPIMKHSLQTATATPGADAAFLKSDFAATVQAQHGKSGKPANSDREQGRTMSTASQRASRQSFSGRRMSSSFNLDKLMMAQLTGDKLSVQEPAHMEISPIGESSDGATSTGAADDRSFKGINLVALGLDGLSLDDALMTDINGTLRSIAEGLDASLLGARIIVENLGNIILNS